MRARLLATILAVLPLSAHGAGAECVERVLGELGWTLAAGDALLVQAGAPCSRSSAAAARAAGDLRATLPHGAGREDALRRLLASPASTCAFRLLLADASRDAVAGLVANERFRFFGVQARWIEFDRDAAAAWQSIASFGRAWQPRAGNHHAIATFRAGGVRAECGVGRQVAQYAAFDELFGSDGFDAAFARDEIVVGTFVQLVRSDSVLLGAGAGTLARDGLARDAARRGRAALLAAPAFLFAVHRGRVGELANQAQNGVIVAIDDAAAATLAAEGGLVGANEAAARAWQLSRTIERRGPRWFQRLLGENDTRAWQLLTDEDRTAATAAQHALDHPVLAGINLYGHAHGVQPLRWWLARLLDRNPGTPYRFEVGNHNLDGEIRERWLAWRLSKCSGNTLVAERATLTSARDPRRAPSGPAP